jgi:hypothetical protein
MSSTFWVVWLSMTAFLIYANVQVTKERKESDNKNGRPDPKDN